MTDLAPQVTSTGPYTKGIQHMIDSVTTTADEGLLAVGILIEFISTGLFTWHLTRWLGNPSQVPKMMWVDVVGMNLGLALSIMGAAGVPEPLKAASACLLEKGVQCITDPIGKALCA